MYFVYVLRLSNSQLYVGYIAHIRRRIVEHTEGKSDFTSRYLPVKLIFYEAYISKDDAVRREQYLKTEKGKTTLRLMLRETLQ